MVKFGKKFFFEDGKSQPIKKTTRKKETKIKEKSLILEKIKFYSKKMIPVVLILILVFGIILLTKSCNSKKKTSKNSDNKAEDKLTPKEDEWYAKHVLVDVLSKMAVHEDTVAKLYLRLSKVISNLNQKIWQRLNLSLIKATKGQFI